MYDESYFASARPKGGYANYFRDGEINRRTFAHRLKAIEARVDARRRRLLDVGCALGDLLLEAGRRGWHAEGMELSPYAAERARARGLLVHVGSLFAVDLADGSYDVVTLYDTLEHLADPLAALDRVRRLVAPGGVVHIVTPNVEGLQSRTLGPRWYHYKPDEHLCYFGPRTLRRAVELAGLRWGGSARTGSYVTLTYVLDRLRVYSPAFRVLARAADRVGLGSIVFYVHVGEMEAWATRP